MAKRIKIKGNPPRGLSKYERQYNYAYRSRGGLGGGRREGNREMMYTVKRVNRDGTVEPHGSPIADKNPMSRPSSARKKLVKEGNRKFIGPRQLRSEIGEDVKAREKDLDYIRGKSPMDVVDYMLGNMHYREPKKLRAPERRRLSLENYDITYSGDEHSYGLGGIAKNPRLKKLLMRLMDRHLGGGQEFDA